MKRLAWWLALGGLALLAAFAQLDRASAARPALAPLVPKPFRSFAQPMITLVALATGTPAEARAEARRLVRIRPMPAEHLYALALAELRAGNLTGYATAFERATERGWRARPIQAAAARAALDAGDVDAAANRIAALWATGPDAETIALTHRLLALEGGRAAFEARGRAARKWDAPAALPAVPDAGATTGQGAVTP